MQDAAEQLVDLGEFHIRNAGRMSFLIGACLLDGVAFDRRCGNRTYGLLRGLALDIHDRLSRRRAE
jgi:hypothetical protein